MKYIFFSRSSKDNIVCPYAWKTECKKHSAIVLSMTGERFATLAVNRNKQ